MAPPGRQDAADDRSKQGISVRDRPAGRRRDPDGGRDRARRRRGLDARAPPPRGARPLLARELLVPRPPPEHPARGRDRDLHVVPLPGELELAELIGLAERDCFIGASLTVKPLYVWTTN